MARAAKLFPFYKVLINDYNTVIEMDKMLLLNMWMVDSKWQWKIKTSYGLYGEK